MNTEKSTLNVLVFFLDTRLLSFCIFEGFSIEDYCYLEKSDRRMRFNNSRDPIFYVFDCIENRPIKTLAKEFVKDSFMDIANFGSKVVA